MVERGTQTGDAIVACVFGVWGLLKKAFAFMWAWMFRRVVSHINWIFLVLLALLATSSICLVVTHIFLEFKVTPWWILEWIPNLVLRFFGTDAATLSKGGSYAVIIADMIAICAFAFAVLPWIQGVVYKIRVKREIQDKFGFEFIPVKQPGKDDLVEMLKRYKGADYLTIFCGGFDWLGENSEMREEIVRLANDQKLMLVSFRPEEHVRTKFEETGRLDLFNTLKTALQENFRFNSGLDDIKCSVIRFFGGAKLRFLFRQSSEQHAFNAGFFGSSEYSMELLLILERFTKAKQWGEPPAGLAAQGAVAK